MLQPLKKVYTGRPGRPAYALDPDYLNEAFAPERNISVNRVAKAIKASRSWLTSARKAIGLKRVFTPWTDGELDDFVREVKTERPVVGRKFIQARLRGLGVKIQRERVRESLRRVDAVGLHLRDHQTATRREYRVPRPNAVWHVDGYHKLIPWGIVIHGLVDGYCRTVSKL